MHSSSGETSSGAAAVIGLRLDPPDSLFFRGGRPIEAGIFNQSSLPAPQTMAGAIRSSLLESWGCDFAKVRNALRAQNNLPLSEAFEAGKPGCGWIAELRFRGPWLARYDAEYPQRLEVLTPVPSILRRLKLSRQVRSRDKRFSLPAPRKCHGLAPWLPETLLWANTDRASELIRGFIRPRRLDARAPASFRRVRGGWF